MGPTILGKVVGHAARKSAALARDRVGFADQPKGRPGRGPHATRAGARHSLPVQPSVARNRNGTAAFIVLNDVVQLKDLHMDKTDPQSQSLSRRYQVRQVTDFQASWVEKERGEDGTFTLQLILDSGVEEYVLEPTEDDIDMIIKLLRISKHTTFDLERKVLMFSNLSA